jgi:putative nucleotidyltransferase with HDIG domain
MEQREAGSRLLEVIQDIAEGSYSNDIMELTREDIAEPIRTIAEAMGLMMVKLEAREFRLAQLVEQIKRNSIAVVSTMAHALAARDQYTEGHAARVAELAQGIAQRMGMDEEGVEYVRLGGLLHDIGKIGFPDALFDTHGKKNPPELVKAIMKHPAIGYDILAGLDFLGPALEYVRCHHERLDGSGYPRRLHAEQIPLGARILAAADGFDAMTTDRPYQKGKSPEEALAILRKQTPKRLSSEVVEAFAGLLEERGLLDGPGD